MHWYIGVLTFLLAIALVAWEGMSFANVDINAPRALISAGLAALIVLFTILKILVDNGSIYLFAWIGLILALVIGYGGWMRWQEHQASGGAWAEQHRRHRSPSDAGRPTGLMR